VPVKKPRNGELDINVSADPSQIGDIAKSVLVLTQFEHKMIS
jgi:hypothetical protein